MGNMQIIFGTTARYSPLEAGYGLVKANTIVAKTTDRFYVRLAEMPDGFGKAHARICQVDSGRELWCGSLHKRTQAEMILTLPEGRQQLSISVNRGSESYTEQHFEVLVVKNMHERRQFGARYGSLEYDLPVVTGEGQTTDWKSLWKTGSYPDIIVDFEQPWKFMLWRGMSYAPCWALDNVLTCLFFTETIDVERHPDCCEMMSDRECRYVHARVIHSTDARVVIHWRCALNDPNYAICDNEWTDEIYYLYPDGVCTRTATIYLDPQNDALFRKCPETGQKIPVDFFHADKVRAHNDQEFIVVNPAGSCPEDNLPPGAMTLMDCQDYRQEIVWPDPRKSLPDLPELEEYIYLVNFRSRPSVFLATPGGGVSLSLQPPVGSRYDRKTNSWKNITEIPCMFSCYIHWPVTRGYSTTPLADRSTCEFRPTHTFLGHSCNRPISVDESGACTWAWLFGIAPEEETVLRNRVREWTKPADLVILKGNAVCKGYMPAERAYLLEVNGRATFTVEFQGDGHEVKPVFLLRGCESMEYDIQVNDRRLNRDEYALGIEKSLHYVQTVVVFKNSVRIGDTIRFE